MRIVIDAMGSDNHPDPEVEGAVLASREFPHTIVLTGDEALLKSKLAKYGAENGKIEVVHTSQNILMTDKPADIIKDKPDSSMRIGMQMVSDGEADAFITAGNTGAAYGIAMLHTLKRIEGVKRPALTVIFPINKRPITFLDVGANIETKPEWMVQFARMGKIYAETVLGIQSARVGLLSNGTERGKGTPVVQATDEFLHGNLEGYVGNIEPIDIMFGKVEVVVSDGFSGNILLKTFEASTRYLSNVIREELTSGILTSVGGLLARPAFNRARKRMDAFEVGGAPLLGVNGVVIISHGSSNANAIKNAVNQAAIAVKSNVVELIRKDIVKVQE